MVLRGLQTLLGRLYDVEQPFDVYDFLVTDRRAVDAAANETRTLDEELLLAETADGAGVALYLDPGILKRLEASDPHRALTEDNLADYCTALEGVSHFVYSTYGLRATLPVSLLELETQAEVDKYAVTVFLLGAQQGGDSYPAHVHARLFDRVSFDTRLRARSISTLPDRARSRSALLPAPGAALRQPGKSQDRSDGARAARFLPLETRSEAALCAGLNRARHQLIA